MFLGFACQEWSFHHSGLGGGRREQVMVEMLQTLTALVTF